jgi:hypothetical protein
VLIDQVYLIFLPTCSLRGLALVLWLFVRLFQVNPYLFVGKNSIMEQQSLLTISQMHNKALLSYFCQNSWNCFRSIPIIWLAFEDDNLFSPFKLCVEYNSKISLWITAIRQLMNLNFFFWRIDLFKTILINFN